MKNKIVAALMCSMVLFVAACGQQKTEEPIVESETTATADNVSTEDTAEATAPEINSEEAMAETTETKNSPEEAVEPAAAEASLRSVAEGFIGKSGSDLVAAIGECKRIHPAGDLNENGKYFGYLQYDDFDVEFESDDESYLEFGDLSGCTVTAVVDSMFD